MSVRTLHGRPAQSGVGYRVVGYPLDGDGVPAKTPRDFALGWLTHPTAQGPVDAWGRPVDFAVAADGALFVSDDASGTIDRLAYDSPTVKTGATCLRSPEAQLLRDQYSAARTT